MVYQKRTQSGAQLENEMIAQLVDQGFERVSIPMIQELQDIFREQVNPPKRERLNGQL